jgi:hypothetical protein
MKESCKKGHYDSIWALSLAGGSATGVPVAGLLSFEKRKNEGADSFLME